MWRKVLTWEQEIQPRRKIEKYRMKERVRKRDGEQEAVHNVG